MLRIIWIYKKSTFFSALCASAACLLQALFTTIDLTISVFELLRFSERLKKYGLSGILSYGLLNTVYYLTTFCFVWFYVAPSPGRMGYVAAVERFLKIMAMVWVGSQVTKIARAAGALALAPLVSKGLTWFTVKFNLESEGKAFMAAVGVCIGIALLLFLVITLLSA
ncbi:hypothetical protein ACHQM5_018529 [Ranunculus cassubicifolius]